MIVRFLGAHNAESRDTKLVSFVIDGILAVDAGSLASELSFAEQDRIAAILLSHGHYDHIKDVPAFAFNNSHRTTKVFAAPQTLEILSSHLLDGVMYPEFTERNSFLEHPALQLISLRPLEPAVIEGYRVLAMAVNHPAGAIGLEIASPDGKSLFYTGDTGPGLSSLWEYVSPQLLIVDMTFPSSWAERAREAGHLCPQKLEEELVEFRNAKGFYPHVVLAHLSPQFEEEIRAEAAGLADELGLTVDIAHEGAEVTV